MLMQGLGFCLSLFPNLSPFPSSKGPIPQSSLSLHLPTSRPRLRPSSPSCWDQALEGLEV
jgi:hypothetical protein